MIDTIEIDRVKLSDANELSTLFDAYRVFYNKDSNPELALKFISDRLKNNESVIFCARDIESKKILGFTQLYKGFSSVSAHHFTILNDLYILPEAREKGIARKLMTSVEAYARQDNAVKITLETGVSNAQAQSLYLKSGYTQLPLKEGDQYFCFEKQLS